MVVEHSFITTMESREALTTASAMLQSLGFQVKNSNAFQMGEWNDLEVSRGKPNSGRAKDITQCLHRIRLEFDRGRVNLAASIQPMTRGNRTFRIGGVFSGAGANSVADLPAKKQRAYSDLLLIIAHSLEALLTQRSQPQEASQRWIAYEQEVRETARSARKRSTIIALSVLGVFIAGIALVVYMSTR